MPMTVCKKTVIARTLRRTVLSAAVLCLSAVSGPFDVLPAQAAESSQPQTLPDGGANLNEAWMRNGGARLYWNTLTQPRQLRMAGAAFADPAAVPELMSSPQGQPAGTSVGKGSRSAAPHSITVDPNAPVRPWPRGASRPAKKDAAATVQQTKTSAQKPVSASPALTPPAAQQGSGKAVPAASAATANPASGKNGTRGGTAVTVNGQSGSATSVQPQAATSAGNGRAGGSSAASAPNGGMPATTPAAIPATTPSTSSPMSLTGTGPAAGALGQTAAGSARQGNANSLADVPIPPPVPALTADDLLPPSNGAGYGSEPAVGSGAAAGSSSAFGASSGSGSGSGSGGAASVRAPLP
ncbi:hypothetical protein [Desulfovibrio intestinalis]|uniref:Uncharacterized protein n=1 Tax=Desulfovibrio intestinalis TaxID=58621 RepID=A0A7W8C393_9BACT|nr:hypothetical protein [Desulfovibrio intestinalis]MBB5144526.1 hypothetical protein [Desulfovibrio intestinalis]